jgi:hypothetical protein
LGGIVEEIVTTSESLVELGQSPWCDDSDGRLKGVESEFESNLVVSFSSAAVGDGNTSLLLCDLDLGSSDDGTGERGT